MSCREHLLLDMQDQLVRVMDSETCKDTIRILTIYLSEYDISPRKTELALRDESSDRLIELYAGNLLTIGKSRKTVYNYVRFLQRFLDDMNKNFVDILDYEIVVWLAKAQNSVSLRTCENYRSYLSAFYHWMTKKKIIKENPMLAIEPIKYEETIRQPFTEIQIDQLRSACPNLRIRAEFELLLSSGIRATELENMNREDVDFSDQSVFVRKGKGNKQRVTFINSVCEHYLQLYLETRDDSDDCLFRNRKHNRVNKDGLEYDLRLLGQLANVKNVHPHRCRRTFATSMYKKGMDIHNIQKLLAHTNINTTMEYITIDEERIKTEYRCYS